MRNVEVDHLIFFHNIKPELFMNYVISPGREFADGAEFKPWGARSKIPDILGLVP